MYEDEINLPTYLQHRRLLYLKCRSIYIEDNNNEEVDSIRLLCRKWSKRYSAESTIARLPKIILLQEEANSIVTDTILDSFVWAAAKIVKESLRDDQQTELSEGTNRFYQYPNELNLEKLTVKVLGPLKTFLGVIYSKRELRQQRERKSCERLPQHMHWCSVVRIKDIYLYYFWLLDCSFTERRDHDFWWMYCTQLGSQFHARRYSSSRNVLLYPV